MKGIQNLDCYDKPQSCYICGNCSKHHENKDGAEKCCTKEISQECNCRHCVKKKI